MSSLRVSIALCTLLVGAACDEPTSPVQIPDVPLSERIVAWDQDGDIFVMNGDGSNLRNLTRTEDSENDPEWSPDGRHIYFSGYGRTPEPQIFRMDADGGNVVQVTNHPEGARQPALSRDGRSIAFITYDPDVLTSLHIGLAIRGPDGRVRMLTVLEGNEVNPTWLPGGRIAFTRFGSTGVMGIYTIRQDGTGLVRITAHGSWFHSWSPDGGRLVVTSTMGVGLYIMSADDFEIARLTTSPVEAWGDAHWSSDGRWIVFPGRSPDGDGLFVVRPDGTDVQRIPSGEAPLLGAHPRWKPLPAVVQ